MKNRTVIGVTELEYDWDNHSTYSSSIPPLRHRVIMVKNPVGRTIMYHKMESLSIAASSVTSSSMFNQSLYSPPITSHELKKLVIYED